MPEYTTLVSIGKAGDSQLTDQLRSNMCMFLDYAFLSMGYYMNVNLNTQYPYGYFPSKLRLSDDSRFPSGSIWDGFKTNWCWEQNIEYEQQPIDISGIYVDNIFLPINTTGSFSYHINYNLGRVVFDQPIPINSNVNIEYSYKYFNIYPDTVQWFKQLTEGTWRPDDTQLNSSNSGIWSIMPDSRSQLPAIVVEISPTTSHTPLGLGGGQWIWKDVLVHIFSEEPTSRDNFVDILSYQCDKRFFLVDKNQMSKSKVFPLNAYGYLINPSSTYPNLVQNYSWTDCYIQDIAVQRSDNNPQSIYYGVARWTLKVNMPTIV